MKKILLFFVFISSFSYIRPAFKRKLARRRLEFNTLKDFRCGKEFIDGKPVLTELSDSEESTSSASDEILDSKDIMNFDEDRALCEKILTQIDGMQDFFDNLGVLICLVKRRLNSGDETGVYNKLINLEKELICEVDKLDLAIRGEKEIDSGPSSVMFY